MNNYSTSTAYAHVSRRDKSGTTRRRKSIIADGDFLNSLWASGFFEPSTRHGAVVGRRLPTNLPCSHPDSPKRKPRRDIGEELRGLFYHKALAAQPNVKAFTLMLSRPVEAQARAKGKHCLAWLHRRVVRQLRPLGGRYSGGAMPFWFVIEESDKGRLHIHGEIAVGPIETEGRSIRSISRVLSPLRNALKVAGGTWDEDRDGKGSQLRFERGTPDFRWAGYCLKSAHKARPERRRYMRQFGFHRWWVAGFEGKAVTASEGVAREAKRLHGAAMA